MKVSVVRPSVRRLSTFSNDISSEASHISHIASIGRGNEKLFFFLYQSNKNSGCYGIL